MKTTTVRDLILGEATHQAEVAGIGLVELSLRALSVRLAGRADPVSAALRGRYILLDQSICLTHEESAGFHYEVTNLNRGEPLLVVDVVMPFGTVEPHILVGRYVDNPESDSSRIFALYPSYRVIA